MLERAFFAAMLLLAGLLGLQTLRLSSEREAHANTRAQAAEDRAAYDRERTRVAVAFGNSVTQALATQQELTVKAEKTQEQYHATAAHLSAVRDDLLGRLRDAEAQARAAAANMPGAPQASGPAAVRPDAAAGLVPRRIGEQDVRAADRADRIRAFAIACDRQYQDAQASREPMN